MALPTHSANRDLMRRINQASVLGIIHDVGPVARTEIARLSGLSLASVSGITGTLIDDGLIIEQSSGVSTGGRRPILLAINRDAAYAIGIKLTDTQVIIALTDLGANLVEQRTLPLGPDPAPEAILEVLGRGVEGLRSDHPHREIIGLGLGLAGVIDPGEGICRYTPFFPWRDVPLRALIADRVGLPVIVENDVNALTVTERRFGAGASRRDFVVVTIGRGIGMGIMLNGALYRGRHGAAGEFGHQTIDPDGPVCACGTRGCVEAFASEPAILAAIHATGRDGMSLDEAIAAARDGDGELRRVFADAGSRLGFALAGVVSLLDPGAIILGGEGVRFIDLLMPALETALHHHRFQHSASDIPIIVEGWGDDAWARGAAALVLDSWFHAGGRSSTAGAANAAAAPTATMRPPTGS